jgi:elongation factor Ts
MEKMNMPTLMIELILKLRKMTGAGVVDCKNALKESGNQIDKACHWLREKSIVSAIEKAERFARQGLVYSYIHGNGILGVLVEMNCETDFVAKTEDFQILVKEIAMQIAAVAPTYVSRDQIPVSIVETEKKIYKSQFIDDGKSEKNLEKIIDGKLEKFYSQVCLYDQIYVRDVSRKETISGLITNAIAKFRENIVVKRFVRFKLGEE